ncbi:hypothetical protein A5904_15055 (plasmid) [Acidithiobacillus caldus]|uniref:hypothetical protein n=1 Tax=Acidithiobacillus caldus TaxID=33059 RepID=UPI00058A4330|nr:hypothetical protein [Acidithiobacillus caldus]AUW34230.1 hypothetical protein A5904_15055 [Acidithiobacillus caldus]QER45652.1 hypothetical protein F0726_02600 [Acidithiobacillus caldus]
MSPIVALLAFLSLLYVAKKLLKGMLYLAFFVVMTVVVPGFALHTAICRRIAALQRRRTVCLFTPNIEASSWSAWLLSLRQRAQGSICRIL